MFSSLRRVTLSASSRAVKTVVQRVAAVPSCSRTPALMQSPVCAPMSAIARRFYASQASAQLAELLSSEVSAERDIFEKSHGGNVAPKSGEKIAGFTLAYDRAEVTLTKKTNSEKVVVSFNVNYSFDDGNSGLAEDPQQQAADAEEIDHSPTPEVTVTVEKGGRKLAFELEFSPDQEKGGFNMDIIELYMYSADKVDDNNYAVSGNVLDASVYDHLIAYLEEQGITSELRARIHELARQHEHQQYMQLLQDMHKFIQQ